MLNSRGICTSPQQSSSSTQYSGTQSCLAPTRFLPVCTAVSSLTSPSNSEMLFSSLPHLGSLERCPGEVSIALKGVEMRKRGKIACLEFVPAIAPDLWPTCPQDISISTVSHTPLYVILNICPPLVFKPSSLPFPPPAPFFS